MYRKLKHHNTISTFYCHAQCENFSTVFKLKWNHWSYDMCLFISRKNHIWLHFVPKGALSIYTPPNCICVQLALHLCQPLSLAELFSPSSLNLVCVLVVYFYFCVFLVVNEFMHLFLWLLAIWILFVYGLFTSFPVELFVFFFLICNSLL